MTTHVSFGDALIRCAECGKRTVFMGFEIERKVEVYRCHQGHVTEMPERKNERFKRGEQGKGGAR